jgi:heparin/heparan-sulfate lyase
MAAWRRPGTRADFRTQDFLWEEPPDEPLDRSTFPLSHCAPGIGKVYARSDWTEDATWFRFECGDFWCNHQHYEVGNFEIFRRAPLATESGEYSSWGSSHALNYLIRTIAHNCILVYQPGETWARMRDGGQTPVANDGGQINKWGWVKWTLPEWLENRELYHRGDLLAYDNRPPFLYVAGDCTPAYAATKLALWVRQIVFLRPGAFVIFDRVVSTRPEYEKTWLLHMAGEPMIEGQTVTTVNGLGRLISHTLLPGKARIRKVYGYGYRGQTYDPAPTEQTPPAPKWRVEVVPPEARTEDLFLHVVFADEPQPVELVRKGDAVGARVGAAEVLFIGKVGGSLGLAGRNVRLKAGLKLSKYEA